VLGLKLGPTNISDMDREKWDNFDVSQIPEIIQIYKKSDTNYDFLAQKYSAEMNARTVYCSEKQKSIKGKCGPVRAKKPTGGIEVWLHIILTIILRGAITFLSRPLYPRTNFPVLISSRLQ